MDPIKLNILFSPDFTGPPQVKTFEVVHQVISIGTGETCDFVLKDRHSQRYHAHIERDEDGLLVVRHMGTGTLIRTKDGKYKNLYLTRGLVFWIGHDMFEVTNLECPRKVKPLIEDSPTIPGHFWVKNGDEYYLAQDKTDDRGHRKVSGAVRKNNGVWEWVLPTMSSPLLEPDEDRAKAALLDALKNAPPKFLRIFGREAEVLSDGVRVAYTVNRFPFRGKVWTILGKSDYQWAIYPFGVPGAPPLAEGHNVSPDKASRALGDTAVSFLAEMDSPWH